MATADTAPAAGLRQRTSGRLLARLGSEAWAHRRAGARADEAIRAFQNELDQVVEQPPPPWLRGPHHIAALMLLALVGLAAVAQTDIMVVGAGRLLPDRPPLVLQPLERSILREVRVKPGDVVARGDVLAILDPTFAQADRDTLLAQQRRLAAEHRRLEAELAGEAPLTPEDADTALQAQLHRQRQSQLASRLRGFDEQIGAHEAAIRTAQEALPLLAQQLTIAADVEAARAKLLEGQVGSRLQYLGARSVRLQAEREHQGTLTHLAELRHLASAAPEERQGFLDEWRRQLLEETVRVRAELGRVDQALTKAALVDMMTVIHAPADATVLDVARRSTGSVLQEAETLVSLVPSGVPLIAEIAIASADVGHARVGAEVVMKVDSFPFQRFGVLHGRLRAVSPASFARGGPAGPAEQEGRSLAPAGEAFHRAQIEITELRLDGPQREARLIAGMTLQAEILAGSRTLLSYLTDPLLRGLREAVREP